MKTRKSSPTTLRASHLYTPPSSRRTDVTTSRPPPAVTSYDDVIAGGRDHVTAGAGVPATSAHETLSVSPGLSTRRVDVDEPRSFGAAVTTQSHTISTRSLDAEKERRNTSLRLREESTEKDFVGFVGSNENRWVGS